VKNRVTRASLLRDMRSAWQESEALLTELAEADVTRVGAEGDWSVKDVLAHLAEYERLYVESVEAHNRGEPQRLEEVRERTPEERNQHDVQRSRQRPLTEIMADERRVFQRLIALVDGFTEDFVVEPQTFDGIAEPVVVGHALQHVCDHRRAHVRALRAWKVRSMESTAE
jgi:hypothetical protein